MSERPRNAPDADEYLVHRRGPPDPDVERLERLLAPLAHDARRAPPRPEPVRATRAAFGAWGWGLSIAAAAAVLIALGSRAVGPERGERAGPAGPSLTVVGEAAALGERSWVEAQGAPRELRLGDLGRVTLESGSRLEVRRLAHEETRLFLERGRLHASVSAEARPRFFQVDTPATRCVDLGCRYTLAVDEAGNAEVEVATGQVAFENEGREVYVPAGARCRATRERGAGTPTWVDGDPALVAAAAAFDAAGAEPAQARRSRAEALLAASADGRAALSAWHLLQDADPAIAAAARARLAALVGPLDGDAPPATGRADAPERERWKERLAPWW